MPHERVHGDAGKAAAYSGQDMIRDLRALSSSVMLLSQKMNYIVRNEKILGRNFIILNKRLRELEQKISPASISSPQSGSSSGEAKTFVPTEEIETLKDELAALEEKLTQNSVALTELSSAIERVNNSCAKAGELKELKYVIDAINPLEFVTLKQAEDLIAGKKIKAKIPAKPKKKKN